MPLIKKTISMLFSLQISLSNILTHFSTITKNNLTHPIIITTKLSVKSFVIFQTGMLPFALASMYIETWSLLSEVYLAVSYFKFV